MKEIKYGVWIDGKKAFENSDYDVAEGFAKYQLRKSNRVCVWLARVGSFVSTPATD